MGHGWGMDVACGWGLGVRDMEEDGSRDVGEKGHGWSGHELGRCMWEETWVVSAWVMGVQVE